MDNPVPAPSEAAIPASLAGWLDPLMIVLCVLVAVWLLLTLFQYWKRRSYNLVSMESAEATGARPDFLKVDRQARGEALERGDEYARSRTAPTAELEDQPQPEEEAEEKRGRFARWARIGAVAFALANLVVISAGSIYRAERTHELFYNLTSWERFQALVEQYWIGAGLAILVIIVQIVRFLSVVMGSDSDSD